MRKFSIVTLLLLSIAGSTIFTVSVIRDRQLMLQKRMMLIEYSNACDLADKLAEDFRKIDGGEESKAWYMRNAHQHKLTIARAYQERFDEGVYYLKPCER